MCGRDLYTDNTEQRKIPWTTQKDKTYPEPRFLYINIRQMNQTIVILLELSR